MATKTFSIIIDDVTGAEADETVTFAIDGVQYEIDLTTTNANLLRESLEKWRTHGRKIRRPRQPTPKEKFLARQAKVGSA
jgi:hypothetical protein